MRMQQDIQTQGIQRQVLLTSFIALAMFFLAACSTNPATGDRQFTAFMSPQQEAKVGAQEHQNIVKQFGLYKDPKLQSYVDKIGARLVPGTERKDTQYKFYVLDTPMVNAFAVPGGYVYLSRGLIALANNEAELAAVTAHEIGHITARHSAERYSTSVVTSLGANLISLAVDSAGASQALGLGSNLFLKSYSRSQENEADTLGVRYLARAGYDPKAMSSFLSALQRDSAHQSKVSGRERGPVYFSTHPETAGRITKTMAEAKQYPQGKNTVNRDGHLSAINGMTYGDSAEQGFARGNHFYHPKLGFTYSVPDGFNFINRPDQVIANSKHTSAVIVFDMVGSKETKNPHEFLTQHWMKDQKLKVEKITVNGLPAATGAFSGKVNGQAMTIRLVAIAWQGKFVRLQIGIPSNAPKALVEDLKRTTYSFRNMTASEKQKLKPHRIKAVTAKSGETIASMAARMAIDAHKEDMFRVLNSLNPGQPLKSGQRYKIISD